MSVFQPPPEASGRLSSDEQPPGNLKTSPLASMNDDQTAAADPATSARLDPHDDARALVRLIQCSFCSYPFRTPVTLPCGRSLCRDCLPPSFIREHVSYPAIASRQQGITCPFAECQKVHPLEDCCVNVVFLQVMDYIRQEVGVSRSLVGDKETSIEEYISTDDTPIEESSEGLASEKGHSRVLPGDRLISTFAFAEMGELHYLSDVVFHDSEGDEEQVRKGRETATKLLDRLKERCHKELECHVCYNLMLDPVTTPCGHTFCRKCLARILDHSSLCAVCRRELALPPSLTRQPSNLSLNTILSSLCPDQVEARAEAVATEESSQPGGLDTPLFVCATSFPNMPFMLHVFEPRYRLMIRRALESNRQFGMVSWNSRHLPQGTMGTTQFMEMGTMLEIDSCQVLADGRSFLLCHGIYRFKVLAHGMLDGYILSRVQKTEDISLAEEEALEAQETRQLDESEERPTTAGGTPDVDKLPTYEIYQLCAGFVQRAQEQSAPWLQGRIIQAFGPPPDDPAIFPYWFASVLPIHDQEKYRLLLTTSVRERLKITAQWVHKIESQRWFRGSACTLL